MNAYTADEVSTISTTQMRNTNSKKHMRNGNEAVRALNVPQSWASADILPEDIHLSRHWAIPELPAGSDTAPKVPESANEADWPAESRRCTSLINPLKRKLRRLASTRRWIPAPPEVLRRSDDEMTAVYTVSLITRLETNTLTALDLPLSLNAVSRSNI